MLPIDKTEEDKIDSPEKIKLNEELLLIEQEIEQAKLRKEEIIKEGEQQAALLIEQAQAQITQAEQELEQVKEAAHNQIEEDKVKAQQEAEQLKEEYKQKGYDDGYNQGFAQITNDMEQKVLAVDKFAQSQFDLKKNIIKSAELDIVNLVVEIAKKVCTKSIELNPDLLKAITVSAIRALKDKEEIKIIINPKLTDTLNLISDKIKEEIPQLKNVRVIEDNSVSADGTIVESMLTRVDSRVVAQINEITEKMMGEYNSEHLEDYLAFEDDSIKTITDIKISDEANIDEFLNELEDIDFIDDKVTEEEINYYDNIDLEALKKEEEQALEMDNSLMEAVNVDTIDDANIDELHRLLVEEEKAMGPEELSLDMEDLNNVEIAENVEVPTEMNEMPVENVELPEMSEELQVENIETPVQIEAQSVEVVDFEPEQISPEVDVVENIVEEKITLEAEPVAELQEVVEQLEEVVEQVEQVEAPVEETIDEPVVEPVSFNLEEFEDSPEVVISAKDNEVVENDDIQ